MSQSGHRRPSLWRRLGTRARAWLPDYLPVAWKMALVFSALLLAGMGVLGTWLLNNQLNDMLNQSQRYGQVIATQLAYGVKEPLLAADDFTLKVLLNNLNSSGDTLGAALYDRHFKLKERVGLLPTDINPAQHGDALQWHYNDTPLTTYFATISVEGHVAGYAAVSLSRAGIVAAQRDARRAMVMATALMGLITVLLSVLLSWRIVKPLRALVAATSAMRAGKLDVHLHNQSNDEIGQLISAYNSMARGLLEKSQVERVLSRFVSPRVAAQMMADLGEVQLGGREVVATVLFADIAGFTRLSERLAPEAVAEMLNCYFNAISCAADFYKGTIDKYMGDCAMLVFGVPEADEEHQYHALCCAVMIQRLITLINVEREKRGLVTARFRIGLNCGPMLAGNLGSQERMQYTVVGDAVNLASRLCSMAEAGEIIVPDALVQDTNVASRTRCSLAGSVPVRGKSTAVVTHRVDGVHGSSENQMTQRITQFFLEQGPPPPAQRPPLRSV